MIGQERNEVGASTLIALLILNKEAPDWRTLNKKHLLYVMISGAAMGCASLPNEDAPRKERCLKRRISRLLGHRFYDARKNYTIEHTLGGFAHSQHIFTYCRASLLNSK